MSSVMSIPKEDLRLLRWPAFFFALAVSAAVAIYYGSQYWNESVTISMRAAQSELAQRVVAIQQIEQEKETITRYIGQYQTMEQEGLLSGEDRLGLLETITETRNQHQLYAASIEIEEQNTTMLQYDVSELNPGAPVALLSTKIRLSLSLLHEEDLTRLLAGILNSGGSFQTENCNLRLTVRGVNFTTFGEKLLGECNLLWYHFNVLQAPVEEGF